MKTAGSSKGSRLGMKKVQLAIEISNRKSCHDKSNDESFGTPTRSLPTPSHFSVVFSDHEMTNDKVTINGSCAGSRVSAILGTAARSVLKIPTTS